MKYLTYLIIVLLVAGCQTKEKQTAPVVDMKEVKVVLTTARGEVTLALSNKTPLHRDNFVKLVKEGRLDSMIFNRVLQGFVVQAGEYDSLKFASIDSIDLKKMDYTVPAEFHPSLFHKRGALGAARTGNPERASSSQSFYIVQKGPRADSLIDRDEKRINEWLQQSRFINALENKAWKDSLLKAEKTENWERFGQLQDSVNTLAASYPYVSYQIPQDQREVYQTLGGTPHLDQNYTVFGEVVSGMEVVDAIAAVTVDRAGRPAENVYILSAEILEE